MPISKFDAAREQIEGALEFIDRRSICAHALAYPPGECRVACSGASAE